MNGDPTAGSNAFAAWVLRRCAWAWPTNTIPIALSIARIDPLPHQLEAVYHYFLKSPRIRFLLADDPGPARPSWPAC